jgi:hypothetical protein
MARNCPTCPCLAPEMGLQYTFYPKLLAYLIYGQYSCNEGTCVMKVNTSMKLNKN